MSFILQNFVPVRVNVRQQAADFQRLSRQYDEHWTPTILILDTDGEERYRIEGFLPVDDYLAQLDLGLAHSAFKRGRYDEAERRFREAMQRHPDTDVAAEAQYWAGVSRYKATDDPSALAATAREFRQRYGDTSWAKKASVWQS